MAGAGRACRASHAPAGRIQSAGCEESGPGVDRPLRPIGQGLLRGNRGPGRHGLGRVDERVHGMLGSYSAARGKASDRDSRSDGAFKVLPVEIPRRYVFRLRRRIFIRRFRENGAGRV